MYAFLEGNWGSRTFSTELNSKLSYFYLKSKSKYDWLLIGFQSNHAVRKGMLPKTVIMKLPKAFLLMAFIVSESIRRAYCVCPQFSISSELNVELEGFVFKSVDAVDLWDCFTKCVANHVCQSINYNLQSLVCLFNKETKTRRPSKARGKSMAVYMENPHRGL